MEEETDDDSYNESTGMDGVYSCTYCNLQLRIKKCFEDCMETHKEINANNWKCSICEFTSEDGVALKKHMNTKHPKRLANSQSTNLYETSIEDVEEDDLILK